MSTTYIMEADLDWGMRGCRRKRRVYLSAKKWIAYSTDKEKAVEFFKKAGISVEKHAIDFKVIDKNQIEEFNL